jgi:hypothetical protein
MLIGSYLLALAVLALAGVVLTHSALKNLLKGF